MNRSLSGSRTRIGSVRIASAWLPSGTLFLLLFMVFLTGHAAAETRVALVIGIDAYQNAPHLTNPVNDARAIGDALRRLNFEVTELDDPDFRTMSRGLREFGIHAQGADTILVYYAGHGMQVDHENYLIPADAKLERAHDVVYETLPLALILDEVSQANKIGIVLLDSCRNNPFAERVARSMSVAGRAVPAAAGLAQVDNVPRNTMVVMAAKANQVAEDGQGHSPFAAAILAHLQIPGLELGLFVRSVRDTVLKATRNRQEPFVFSSLGADPFYFYPRPPNRPPVIGPIATLIAQDRAGPMPFGIPRPVDPDLDPLTVRIIGLPRGGQVIVEGRQAAFGQAFSLDHFMAGTFKPDGTMLGPVGTLDILVEDGRGGSATGSLPIVVQPLAPPPAAVAPAPPSPPLSASAVAPPSAPTVAAVPPAAPTAATPSPPAGPAAGPAKTAALLQATPSASPSPSSAPPAAPTTAASSPPVGPAAGPAKTAALLPATPSASPSPSSAPPAAPTTANQSPPAGPAAGPAKTPAVLQAMLAAPSAALPATPSAPSAAAATSAPPPPATTEAARGKAPAVSPAPDTPPAAAEAVSPRPPGPSPLSPAKDPAPTVLAFASPPLPPISHAPPVAPPPVGVTEGQALASEVPCSLLDVRQSPHQPGRLSVTGPVLPGPVFSAFLRQLDGPAGPPVVAIERLDSRYCPAVTAIGRLVRRSRERGGLRLALQNSPIPVGGRLVVDAEAVRDGALYADLYSADGFVQHLRRGNISRNSGGRDIPITASVSGSPGLRLLVVMATPRLLGLEKRPTVESDTDYLSALRLALADFQPDAPEPQVEVLPLSIVAAARLSATVPVASPRARPLSGNEPRCANIVAQVQLGLGLSDEDRRVLQTSCGR